VGGIYYCMPVSKNYSISIRAHGLLKSESRTRYDYDGIKSSVIVDALRWEFDPTLEQQALKQAIKGIDDDNDLGFTYTRGQTKSITVRLPEDLYEEFINESRRIYGRKKAGKYLSKIIVGYYLSVPRKCKDYINNTERQSTDWINDLKENDSPHFGYSDIPEDLDIPKTHRVAAPLVITRLRELSFNVYNEKVVSNFTHDIINHRMDVTDRTLETYEDKVKEMLEETVSLYGSNVGGYYIRGQIPNDEITEDIEGWISGVESKLSDEYRTNGTGMRDGVLDTIETVKNEYEFLSEDLLYELEDLRDRVEKMDDEGEFVHL